MKLRAALVLSTLLLGLTAPASAVVFYATSDANDMLYRIDPSAGYSLTAVGQYSLVSTSEFHIGGLEFDAGGTLWGVSSTASSNLYRLDPSNAATFAVGPLNTGFVFEGGLAFDPTSGTAYAVNQNTSASPNLMTVNMATGQATALGRIGASGEHDFGGLVFDAAGALYGIDRVSNALWRIDKNNPAGAGTVKVGPGLGFSLGSTGGLTRDPDTGVVYGYGSFNASLFTVDLSTGLGAVVHTFPAGSPQLYALAAVPEPAAISALLLGAACLRRRPSRG